ncbi:MAG: tannase/feruloyl esterase family alpha/beta hydrolase [Novosphingobium sp.]|nr:tannase/feruloyl esterase family alpha/beta hydrolase [Novosphingobium sp.]
MTGTGPAGADQPQARGATPLANVCNAGTLQGIASRLPVKVTVGKVAEQPAFADGTRYFPASASMPAFCQVTGSYVTNPATGKTANFLATLPENWNGKYLQLGCSGHCGGFAVSDAATPLIVVTNQGTPGEIMRKGYASFATDEGHTNLSAGAWAIKGPGLVDDDAITDYLYRSHKVLARMGKDFTRAFYARAKGRPEAISRSYFGGCSGGGRDALVAASYFPEEFDGIIAGSPYNLAGRAFHSAATAIATVRAPDGRISPGQLALVNKIVDAQCDGLDGVKDGLIQNPMACNFRPERDLPKCSAGASGDQCFTPAQIETLAVVLSAVTDDAGTVVQPGYSVSNLLTSFEPEATPKDPSAANPWPDTPTGGGFLWVHGDAAIRVFAHRNDPAFATRSILTYRTGGPGPITGFHAVVPRAEAKRVFAADRLGIGHFPENYDRLIGQRRKLLIWHNLSDDKLTPYMSINLYKQLAARHGGYARLQNSVRLFGLPGTAHCSGGGLPVGPGSFDALGAMENWVEKGVAPDALLATLYEPTSFSVDFAKPLGRTMPLCKFPEMARYKGTGSVMDAANWTCPAGDRSMLTLGESGRRAGVLE